MQETAHLREGGEYIQALHFKIPHTGRKWRKGNNHLPIAYERGFSKKKCQIGEKKFEQT